VFSDKLSNIRAIGRGLKTNGDAIWGCFNNSYKDDQAWYYCSIRDNIPEPANMPAYAEFAGLIEAVFGSGGQVQGR